MRNLFKYSEHINPEVNELYYETPEYEIILVIRKLIYSYKGDEHTLFDALMSTVVEEWKSRLWEIAPVF